MSTKRNGTLENIRFLKESRTSGLFVKRNSWFTANLTECTEISYMPPAATGTALPTPPAPTRVVRLLITGESTGTHHPHPKFKFTLAFILGLPFRGCGQIQDDVCPPLQDHSDQFHGPTYSLCPGYSPLPPLHPTISDLCVVSSTLPLLE